MGDEAGAQADAGWRDREKNRVTGPIDTIREALNQGRTIPAGQRVRDPFDALTEVEQQLADWRVEAQHHNDRAVAAEQRANEQERRNEVLRAQLTAPDERAIELADALRIIALNIPAYHDEEWHGYIDEAMKRRDIARAALDRHTQP